MASGIYDGWTCECVFGVDELGNLDDLVMEGDSFRVSKRYSIICGRRRINVPVKVCMVGYLYES